MRAVGNGMKVVWISWYKEENWKLSEVKSLKKLGVEVYLMGKGFSMDKKINPLSDGSVVVDKVSDEEHKKAANKALDKAKELLNEVEVLVLDEINNAVDEGLVEIGDLMDLLFKRGKTHLILTGRNVKKEVLDLADLVTECKKIKHPYDKGELAMRGLDY